MAISVFDLFSIGIGPSSSHTVGPMRAARHYSLELDKLNLIKQVAFLKVDLYGSLALTGEGHGTDLAVILGLEGETPEGIDPNAIQEKIAQVRRLDLLNLLGKKEIVFKEKEQLIFHKDKFLPFHPNAVRFTVFDEAGNELLQKIYYSLGGGFFIDHETAMGERMPQSDKPPALFPFRTAEQLLKHCREQNKSIAEIMLANELVWRNETQIREGLLKIWKVMQDCVERGCHQDGILPGGLNLKRRASGIYRYLQKQEKKSLEDRDPAEIMDWVSLWALAVNEENAAGARVVTAPTNGASGVIPSVIHYYMRFVKGASLDGVITFFLTAGAMGILYKEGASISAAEMGCMGEVGVACSMAAAGLTAAIGATNEQIENAAEIGMEHNLGLTCDPIKGLVQIPCIERNTMGAAKAINASRLARHGDGSHFVSLDQVIATMKQTGTDMKSIYKETSLGGLAVNVPEC